MVIKKEDLKGIFHVHSDYSDGKNSLAELVAASLELGFEYLVVSDHSQSADYAGGLTLADIDKQHKEIAILNKKHKNFQIIKGIESEIRKGGDLDNSNEVLAKFDFVIGSVHQKQICLKQI